MINNRLATVAPWWSQAYARFVQALDPDQRLAVNLLLANPNRGGCGLRDWLRILSTTARDLPLCLPTALVDVYLTDSDALPLHDCEKCGLAVPVTVSRGCMSQRIYFAACPACGGRTGLFAYWSAQVFRGSEQVRHGS